MPSFNCCLPVMIISCISLFVVSLNGNEEKKNRFVCLWNLEENKQRTRFVFKNRYEILEFINVFHEHKFVLTKHYLLALTFYFQSLMQYKINDNKINKIKIFT